MNNLFVQLLLVLLALLATIGIFWAMFSTSKAKTPAFSAADGTRFKDEQSLQDYEALCDNLQFLYDEASLKNNRRKDQLLGLNTNFIKCLTQDSFKDLKTLLASKQDFILFAELLARKSSSEA